MAHAGTTSDLRTPRTATNGLWQAFVAAILVLAIAAGIVAVTSNLVGNAPVAPAANPGYQIQAQPAPVNLHKVVGHKGAMIYQ